MKKIKVKILGHPLTDTFAYSHFILTTLKKYYDVEISEKPEYLFYHDSTFNHHQYDCIKIFYTGENISPNFNECDYAISFDYLEFEDRHYRMPLYLVASFYTQAEIDLAGKNYLTSQGNFIKKDIERKKNFCSFIYSNYRAEEKRKEMFFLLQSYKQVNAGGAFLNNMGGKRVNNKLEFDSSHKFSIAFENSSRSGYTTEKIVGAIVANTVPIYWGNPNIAKEFNTKRFINCHDYNSFEEVLEKVKEIDADDELFIKMINEPIAAEGYNFEKVREGFDDFLRKIIDQPLSSAARKTINPVKIKEFQRYGKIIEHDIRTRSARLKLLSLMYKPFKKIQVLEKLKQSYFQKK